MMAMVLKPAVLAVTLWKNAPGKVQRPKGIKARVPRIIRAKEVVTANLVCKVKRGRRGANSAPSTNFLGRRKRSTMPARMYGSRSRC